VIGKLKTFVVPTVYLTKIQKTKFAKFGEMIFKEIFQNRNCNIHQYTTHQMLILGKMAQIYTR